MQNKQQKCCG